jgi:hypothetical protein
MNTVQGYIDRFGPIVGPKLFHLERSRAAYKGVSTRRRRRIEAITGKPFRKRVPARKPADVALPLFPESAAVES